VVQRKVTRNYILLSVSYIVRYDKTDTFPCFVNISAGRQNPLEGLGLRVSLQLPHDMSAARKLQPSLSL
jgi:hypothetical protein